MWEEQAAKAKDVTNDRPGGNVDLEWTVFKNLGVNPARDADAVNLPLALAVTEQKTDPTVIEFYRNSNNRS